ncbi:NADH dehydrogenase [ubiquinone] 1 beta subcomplex subunit 4 [Rana temporaria]|uniref:NADH dehydrogenase [ubiquinone] 1 beta subcomplex subunit 4 n=1 Tax=Rana temporaria TaxID=8407 RepID=UPI001AAE133A|nr:NADH dehydrogenase [ubiquinone] 1 beta subcomplex subunit 4 [Rana temporaria]
MSGVSFPCVMADYKESRFVSRPEALDPARYYELTPERRKLQEERTAIRAGLKRQYQLQLNDPRRKGLVQDPAVDRWMFSRNYNILPNARLSASVWLRTIVYVGGPLLLMYTLISKDRALKQKEYREGKNDNPLSFFL